MIRLDNGTFAVYFAARTPDEGLSDSSVIAMMRSDDLIHWEPLPPAFEPKTFGTVEVPTVVEIDGTWYLLGYTSNGHISRGAFSDPCINMGTIYASADNPYGPFEMRPDDNSLLGDSMATIGSCRTVCFNGKHYAYTVECDAFRGPSLSLPYLLVKLPDGRLRAHYAEASALLRQDQVLGPKVEPAIRDLPRPTLFSPCLNGRWTVKDGVYRGMAEHGWQSGAMGVGADDCEAVFTLSFDAAAAGIVWRPDRSHRSSEQDVAVIFDANWGKAICGELPALRSPLERRSEFTRNTEYRIRMIWRSRTVTVFCDDALILHGSLAGAKGSDPELALWVDRGTAEVKDMEIWGLK